MGVLCTYAVSLALNIARRETASRRILPDGAQHPWSCALVSAMTENTIIPETSWQTMQLVKDRFNMF